MTETALYRYFDGDRRLIYVGISQNVMQRISAHAHLAWAKNARNITIEMHPTRSAALLAEATAIRNEKPLRNSINKRAPVTRSEVDILLEIKDFCAQQNMPKTRFGALAVNDPALFSDLENGRELRRKTLSRILAFMEKSPPLQEGTAS